MSNEPIEPDTGSLFTDDDVVAFTQKTRKQLVDEMVADGKMPEDKDSRVLLLSALSDMDKLAINNKRLGAQQKNAAKDREAMMIIAKIRERIDGSNIFEQPGNTVREVEIDSSRLPPANAVKGETDIGLDETTYDDFVAQFDEE